MVDSTANSGEQCFISNVTSFFYSLAQLCSAKGISCQLEHDHHATYNQRAFANDSVPLIQPKHQSHAAIPLGTNRCPLFLPRHLLVSLM
jgi:hypothetical protein